VGRGHPSEKRDTPSHTHIHGASIRPPEKSGTNPALCPPRQIPGYAYDAAVTFAVTELEPVVKVRRLGAKALLWFRPSAIISGYTVPSLAYPFLLHVS